MVKYSSDFLDSNANYVLAFQTTNLKMVRSITFLSVDFVSLNFCKSSKK